MCIYCWNCMKFHQLTWELFPDGEEPSANEHNELCLAKLCKHMRARYRRQNTTCTTCWLSLSKFGVYLQDYQTPNSNTTYAVLTDDINISNKVSYQRTLTQVRMNSNRVTLMPMGTAVVISIEGLKICSSIACHQNGPSSIIFEYHLPEM